MTFERAAPDTPCWSVTYSNARCRRALPLLEHTAGGGSQSGGRWLKFYPSFLRAPPKDVQPSRMRVRVLRKMSEAGTISPHDPKLIYVTDSVDDAIAHLRRHVIEPFGLRLRESDAPGV